MVLVTIMVFAIVSVSLKEAIVTHVPKDIKEYYATSVSQGTS